MTRTLFARAAIAAVLTLALTSTAQVAFGAPASAAQSGALHVAAASKHLSKTRAPRISGRNTVGAVLKVVTGMWKPGGVALHYQWLSNGRPVSGATKSRFTVRSSDAGKRITVSVRGTKHGYRTVTRYSKSLTIAKPAKATTTPPATPPQPVVKPTPRVVVPVPVSPPATVPDHPSPPILTTHLGTVTAAWDGMLLDSAGSQYPRTNNISYIRLLVGSAPDLSDATYQADTIQNTGAIVVTGLTIGHVYYFAFIAENTAGVDSPPSPIANIAVQSVLLGNIDPAVGVQVQNSKIAISGDGSYRVGTTVAPGTYVTSGSTTFCYWSRVSSFDGQLASIIDNDLGSGQRVITVLSSDYGVTFSDCGSWVRLADAPAVTAIQTGTYLVGTQLAAGEYQATAPSDGCYWATLSSFTGDLSAIIANDFVGAGPVIVDVPAGAVGFESSGCGVWTRIG